MPTVPLKISARVLRDIELDTQYQLDTLTTLKEKDQCYKQGYQAAREELLDRIRTEVEDEARRSSARGLFYLTDLVAEYDRTDFPVDGKTGPAMPEGYYVATARTEDGQLIDMMLSWEHREGIDTDDYLPRDIAELLREQAYARYPEMGQLESLALSTFKVMEDGKFQSFVINSPRNYRPLLNGDPS